MIFSSHGWVITAVHVTPPCHSIRLYPESAPKSPTTPPSRLRNTSSDRPGLTLRRIYLLLKGQMEFKAERDGAFEAGISLAFPGRAADKAAAVPESRKTRPCQKALGVSSTETSSAVLRPHGHLRYRVAVKKTSVAKVGSGFWKCRAGARPLV